MKIKRLKVFVSTILATSLMLLNSQVFAEDEIINENINVPEYGEIDNDVVSTDRSSGIFVSDDQYYSFSSMDAKQKASNGQFYIDIYEKISYYLWQFDNGAITEDQLTQLIENNITPSVPSKDYEVALQKSEVYAKQGSTPPGVDYTMGYFGYSSREINLWKSSPKNGTKTYQLAQTAEAVTKNRYSKYTRYQGNGDAFRHAYWSALMTKYISRDWAYKAGYAHENLSPGAASSSLDTKMDIENNYRGRVDGTNYASYSDYNIAENIADSVSYGKKVRIRTYTYGTPDLWLDGQPTKYQEKFVATSEGGRIY